MNEELKQVKTMAENGLIGAYKKKTYFVMAENNFLRNPKYTVNQKMVYLCLQSYTGSVDSCFPSKDTIAKSLSLAVNTIYKNLNELVELGAILVINQITETNRKTSNLYILAEINKDTGEFVPESILQFKPLTMEPIKVRGK